MTLLRTLRQIQRPTTQGHSSHAKYENSRKITFKGSTNLGFGLPTEDALSDDPQLESTC